MTSAHSLVLRGHSASPGLAVGRAFWVVDAQPDAPHRKISRRDVRAEGIRLKKAYREACLELKDLETKISAAQPPGLKDIFSVHRLMLDDPVIRARIDESIRRNLICAEWAVERCYEDIVRSFARMKNRIVAARRDDVQDAMHFLLGHLAGGPRMPVANGSLKNLPQRPFVAVAHELSPAQTAALMPSKIAGMVTRLGGRSSHAAIIAREMGIPLIFGLPAKSLNQIHPDDILCIDGAAGRVLVNPPSGQSERFRTRISSVKKMQLVHLKAAALPTRTADGVEVFLRANIESGEEGPMVKKYGAAGVGLFRTEYLYLGPIAPDEESLYRAYRKVARGVSPAPLVVRTMDLGGDKFLSPVEFSPDLNPMLGMRAIRLCLAQPKLFLPQIRAALRAAVSGNIKLCLPMVSAVEEIMEVRKLMDHAMRNLARRRVPFRQMPVGIMVEVPSVAIRIDRFLPHADFFSIGTNDLVQYTLAVSRTQEQVAYLYRPMNPSVLWLLSRIVGICADAKKDVSLCGEEANNPLIVPFLLGIGLRDLSMAPPAILDIKKLISGLDIPQCRAIAADMLELASTREVERYIRMEVYPMLKTIIPQHYSYISMESEL